MDVRGGIPPPLDHLCLDSKISPQIALSLPPTKKIEKTKPGSSHGLCLDDLDIKTLLRDGDDDADEQRQQDDGGGGGGGEKV